MSIQFLKPASSPFADENDSAMTVPDDADKFTIDLDDDDADIEVVTKDDDDAENVVTQGVDNQDDDDDDLSKYGENVQKRIKKLSYEYHNSERNRTQAEQERDQALETAKRLQAQLDQMSGHSHQTTTALAKQMQSSHETAIANTQALLQKAYDDGNGADIAKHTADLSRLNSELTNIKSQASTYENAWKQEQERKKNQPQPQARQQPQGQQPQVLAVEAQKWLTANPWFTTTSTDPNMIAKQQDVLEFNNSLLRSGRYTTNDPRLYQAVDDYIKNKYPERNDQMGNGQSPTSGQPPVAGVQTSGKKNPGSGKKSRTVELTKSELDLARKFKLTPKQYALSKQKLQG